MVEEWLLIEKYFSDSHYNFLDDSISPLNIGSDDRKILFCAPHALNHFRDGHVKIADLYTGSMCKLIARNTGQSSLVASRMSNDIFGLDQSYVDKVKNASDRGLMIVDLHGMSDRHGCDICIGSGSNPSDRVSKVIDSLARNLSDYNVSINSPFDGSASYTITNYVQNELMGDALQIEIATKYRDIENQTAYANGLLASFIESFKACIDII